MGDRRVIVFDVNETLLDLRALLPRFERLLPADLMVRSPLLVYPARRRLVLIRPHNDRFSVNVSPPAVNI